MTDKEYELVEKYLRKKYGNDYVDFIDIEGQSYLDGFEEGRKETVEKISELEKENKELKSQISTLLSCSNCPDNKGGYICDKEYNNKCLAQKIQYINELKKQLELKKC